MRDKYGRWIIVLAGSLLALVLHVGLGWGWGVLAGAVVGAVISSRGWLYGGLALAVEWAGLVIWNMVVAGGPTLRMAAVMGELIGVVPGWLFILMTLSAGFGLGAVGGLGGQQLRLTVREFLRVSPRRSS